MDIFVGMFHDFQAQFAQLGRVFAATWYIILPVPLYVTFKWFWMIHIQDRYWESLDWMLLEIIPPRDIEKSPLPMESIFVAFAGVSKSINPVEEYVQGMFPDGFSLEIVGDEGMVHFYVRTQRKYRNLVEAHFYGQYPDIEIVEVPDYVDSVPRLIPNEHWNLWGSDFQLVADDAFPIRTYKKFEEDVTGKMIDPLAGIVEVMGKLGPGQKMWYQLVITPEKETWFKTGRKLVEKLKGKEVKSDNVLERLFSDMADIFKSIFSAMKGPVEFAKKEKKEEQPLEFKLSPGEREALKAVEDNLGKNMFKTKMRFVYVGRREGFDKAMVSNFIGGIKQFADHNLNGFKPHDPTKTAALYVFTKSRLLYRQRKILRRYRLRSNDGLRFYLSTEELATMWHMPDMQVTAPSVVRVEAKRSGAPANLPVE